ncbi:MAG: hypothetical protein EOP45_18740, partial [Sphingobacteriaceae bacterium]
MARLSLWKGDTHKGKDYYFIDRIISGQMYASGTGVYVHKYLGPKEGPTDTQDSTPATIQDVLLLENRDRKYDPNVYELRGTYNVQDNDLDLKQFGAFFNTDSLFIEFH